MDRKAIANETIEILRQGFYEYKGKKIEILEEFSNEEPGYIIEADDKKGLKIMTQDKVILVKEIQGENAKRMSINDFLRGNKIEVGKIFK